jgi:hypothetical protein
MKIKIMYPNDRGRIELTKDELEKLLNESYSEGYSDGCSRYYSISTPSYPYITYCNGSSVDGLSADKAIGKCDCDGTVTYASSVANDAAISAAHTTTKANHYVTGQTETIEICNVNGIGVVKTNEV